MTQIVSVMKCYLWMKGVKMLQRRWDLLNEELRLIVFLDQGVKHSIRAGSFPDESQ